MSGVVSKTIVIIDDDEAVRDSTCVLLQSYGYPTQTYPSADVYLQETSGALGDCLIVDLQMPGLSGVELVEALRARAIATPVILMTANVESLGARGQQAGAAAILRKPFAEDALIQAVARACERN